MNRLPLASILFFFLAVALTGWGQQMSGGRQRATGAVEKKPEYMQQAYAWYATDPLGLRTPAVVDTLEYNYFQHAIPSECVSYAYACTGNYGAEGKNMLFLEQAPISNFFLQDAQMAWTPAQSKQKFYNTRIPMTLLSYDAGGGRYNAQERLNAIFTANANKKTQIGANIDYLYSKGSYEYQAAKDLSWGLNGSYLGDRYELQAAYNHYNMLNKENGGITDDLYITDPAVLQGGVTSIAPKSIPTNLTDAHTRIVGGELFINNRYKIGFWHDVMDEEADTVLYSDYIPVTSFIWTLQYKHARHGFIDDTTSETREFFEHTYLNPDITDDLTSYHAFTNTVGAALLEGFNKYAKFGLAAFLTYESRKFVQAVDTLDRSVPDEINLDEFPADAASILDRKTQSLAWVGAELTKQQGSILHYKARGEIGILGDAAGEVKLKGEIETRIPLFRDTVGITAYGQLYNTSAPYLLQEYKSNHFVWHNDFGMEQRLRLGGIIHIPQTNTTINVATETLKNLIYFGPDAVPLQESDPVQVFSANLYQNFKVGILHWDNKITYQTSTNDAVMPLPKLAVYSNLYLLCYIATLHLQLGIDCDYYTSYYAPGHQPATATFYNQREMKVGNYPFMTAYANMKLGRTRFYVMMTHVNQGLIGGNNYFSIPHYPLNPRRFQLGLSIDFQN